MKIFYLLIVMLCYALATFAQFGIKAGINMANQIKSFRQADIIEAFKTENLNGYQIGLMYQLFPVELKMGFDAGIFISQKGFSYTDSVSINEIATQGYKEFYYLEMPINIRYRYDHRIIGAYGTVGLYAGYFLKGESVNETDNIFEEITFARTLDHFDYGFCLGAGIEMFRKLQLGLSWSRGLKNVMYIEKETTTNYKKDNRVFSINMVYLFK